MIYRFIVIIILALLSVWFFRSIKSNNLSIKYVWKFLASSLKDNFKLLFKNKPHDLINYLQIIKSLLYYLTVAQFIIMALSGFIPIIIFGGSLTGLALIIHVTIAPLFCLSLAIYIILSAYQFRLSEEDYRFIFQNSSTGNESGTENIRVNFRIKTYFWLSAILSIPVILSIIFSLYPLFNSENSEFLIGIHRYSVILFTVTFVIQLYNSIILYRKFGNNSE